MLIFNAAGNGCLFMGNSVTEKRDLKLRDVSSHSKCVTFRLIHPDNGIESYMTANVRLYAYTLI